MDPTDFDRLSRAFAEALSRRRLSRLVGSLPLAALLPGLASGVTEARGKHHGKHTLHAQKKKKKKKKKTTKPVSPPASPPGSPPASPPPPPPPPPAPSCPQAAAPHRCASANVCVPACPFGKVFDATTCKCVCAEQNTCCHCTCNGGTPLACFPGGVPNQEACKIECGNFCSEDPNSVDYTFAAAPGSNAACDESADTCTFDCVAETVCGTKNQCPGPAVDAACGIGGFCSQPLGGGPTRCSTSSSSPPSMAACNCTSHQGCVDLFGPGAFCADTTGCNTPCSGHTICSRSV